MAKKRSKQKKLLAVLMAVALAGLSINFLAGRHYAILDTKGIIADEQRELIIFSTVLSLLIIVPVFWLTFHIVRTYRVGAKTKKKVKYQPEWDGNKKLELLWWGIPSILILVLSVITWQTSHSLDPYRPIESNQRPLTIQVVAMQWKWLFLYPEQQVATVNYVQMPVDRPVKFVITSDAPMNSFWIPQLGGQIYAMTGMSGELNLMADEEGAYRGSSANLSGEGFAGMNFAVNVTSEQQFNTWSNTAHDSPRIMNGDMYHSLSTPSQNTPPATYQLADVGLYDTVIAKYMNHGAGH
jgi:cytochrome o ubiquinol oxidase subunit II